MHAPGLYLRSYNNNNNNNNLNPNSSTVTVIVFWIINILSSGNVTYTIEYMVPGNIYIYTLGCILKRH